MPIVLTYVFVFFAHDLANLGFRETGKLQVMFPESFAPCGQKIRENKGNKKYLEIQFFP